MPCDTISTIDLDAGKMDAKHVKIALEAMGLHPRHTRANIYDHDCGEYNHVAGIATWRSSRMAGNKTADEMTGELRREYSHQILKSQADRFGWNLKATKSKTGNLAYTIAKR